MDGGVDTLNLCFHMAECLDIIVSSFSVLSAPVVMWWHFLIFFEHFKPVRKKVTLWT